MKLRMVDLGFAPSARYPYDYRIELIDYGLNEFSRMSQWLEDNEIPHTCAGTGNVFYLTKKDASLFALTWQT